MSTPPGSDVYVISHDHEQRTAIDKTLSAAGFRVKLFSSAQDFLVLADAVRPGSVIAQLDLPDISGVIWVDQATSELREMDFRFVNAGALTRFDAGGFTRFSRVRSGAWIVDEWQLRAPTLAIRLGSSMSSLVAVGRRDTGGGVLRPTR